MKSNVLLSSIWRGSGLRWVGEGGEASILCIDFVGLVVEAPHHSTSPQPEFPSSRWWLPSSPFAKATAFLPSISHIPVWAPAFKNKGLEYPLRGHRRQSSPHWLLHPRLASPHSFNLLCDRFQTYAERQQSSLLTTPEHLRLSEWMMVWMCVCRLQVPNASECIICVCTNFTSPEFQKVNEWMCVEGSRGKGCMAW